MADIDELVGSALKRIATPGDPTGVVDSIRARVDAGDTGAPAASSGFGRSAVAQWLPWVGLIVVAGVVGGSLGPLGVLGHETVLVSPPATGSGVLDRSAIALECVDGPRRTELPGGERVFAVQRTADSAWVGVRDPLEITTTVWVPVAAVTLDEGQDVSALPLGGACPIVTTTLAAPPPPATAGPPPIPAPNPGPAPQPPAPGDTTAPVIGQAWVSPTPFYNADPTVVHAVVSDASGISSVAISWSGSHTGSGSMYPVGGEWQFSFSTTENPTGVMTFTIVAYDTAGNASAPASVQADHQYFG